MSHPVSSAVVDLLGRPSIFRTPGWLPESTWHMHIPFAFLLMDLLRPGRLVELGTQKGASYCAFCEGAAAFGTGTRLSAVDHWDGDHQTGAYARDTYDVLRAHHDPLYGGFSTLLRESFDDARPRFEDGSIDLLHIDGLHTYEAVRHDFETWLPKMSRSGVILMHDTEVRTGDFGVWRFWEEIRERYPTLNFPFGYGLGVVAVGEAVPDFLLELCRLPEAEKAALYALFEALGDRVRLLNEHQEASRNAATYLEQGLQMQKVYTEFKATAEAQIETAMAQYQAMFAQATALQTEVVALITERDALMAGRPAPSLLAEDTTMETQAALASDAGPSNKDAVATRAAGVEAGETAAPRGEIFRPDPARRVEFQCNVCGTRIVCTGDKIGRETASCEGCGSTVRMRSIIHLLSTALYGRSIPLPEFPQDPAVVGKGLSDWVGYAEPLQEKFSYTNTFYHQEPLLDIENVPAALQGSSNFLISTDVFEHTLGPALKAFAGAFDLLKPGGWLILTVPFTLDDQTVEHYPQLSDFTVAKLGETYLVVGQTADGEYELYRDPVFHGGPGQTLEMRVFCRKDVEANLRAAGFTDIRFLEESVPEYGILLTENWSLPVLARKPL